MDRTERIRRKIESLLNDWKDRTSTEAKYRCEVYKELLEDIDSMQEEPVSRTPADIEAAMQEVEEKSKAFTDAHKGENADTILAQMRGEEPVSEDLGEASKDWLRPQLDKSYAKYGESKMMEFTHFDGYAMLDAIEFGAEWQKEQMTSCIEQCRNEHLKCKECTDDDRDKALHQYAADICGVMLTRINGCVIIKED